MSGTLNLSQINGVSTGFNLGAQASAGAAQAVVKPISMASLNTPSTAQAPQGGGNTINIANLDATPTTNLNAGPEPSAAPKQGGILRNVGAGALDSLQGLNSLVNAPFTAANYVAHNTDVEMIPSGARSSRAPVPQNMGAPENDNTGPETGALAGPAMLQRLSGQVGNSLQNYQKNTSTTSPLEYAARGVGEMAPYAVTGDFAGVGAAAKSLGTLVATGAGSGLGQEAGNAIDPNGIGGAVGSLVGGLLPLGSAYAASKALEGLGDVAPVTKGLQNQQAARILASSDPNLAQTRATIQGRLTPGASVNVAGRQIPLGPNGEILPSVDPAAAPSVAQLSNSPGMARLEEGLKASGAGDVLQAKDTAQGAARAAAVRQIDPDEGDASTLSDFFRRAQQSQDEAYQQRVAQETTGRDAALGKIPGASGETSTYQAGQQIQGALQGADAARKADADKLFDTLRDKNPQIDMSALKGSTDAIRGGIASTKAGDVSPAESGLLDRATAMGQAQDTSWGQVQQLRSEVGIAIGESTKNFGAASPSTRRLMQLKTGIDDATANGVGKLPQQSDEWAQVAKNEFINSQPVAAVARAKASLEQLSADGRARETTGEAGTVPGARPATSSGAPDRGAQQFGNQVSGDGGLSLAEHGSASAQGAVAAGWSAADRDTYTQALAAHAARKQLYANPEIGPLLGKAPGGDLKLAPEEIVKRAVPAGPAGARMARAISATAKDNPAIADYYHSIVGLDLRNSVVRDGQVNRGLLQSWARNHNDLLSQTPEIADRLNNLDTAQQFVDEAAKNAALSRDVFNTRAISSLLDGHDPTIAMQSLLNGSASDAAKFMTYVRRDPAAVAGAQKAMADYLAQALLSPTGAEGGAEIAGIAKIRTLLRSPAKMSVLREVSGSEAPATLRKIVDAYDLHNTAAISRLGAAGSRTTPLTEVVAKINEPRTMLGRIFQHFITSPAANAVAGGVTGGPMGGMAAYTGTAIAKAHLTKARAAVARILSEALADPRVFMKLTAPVPQSATAEAKFIKQLRSLLANSAMQLGAKSQ